MERITQSLTDAPADGCPHGEFFLSLLARMTPLNNIFLAVEITVFPSGLAGYNDPAFKTVIKDGVIKPHDFVTIRNAGDNYLKSTKGDDLQSPFRVVSVNKGEILVQYPSGDVKISILLERYEDTKMDTVGCIRSLQFWRGKRH